MTELLALFLNYPAWAAEKAIGLAKRESPKFVPSVPAVEVACEQVFGETRQTRTWVDDWNARTQLQLEERRQIEEAPRPKAEVVAKIRADMLAAGMPILGDRLDSVKFTPEAVKERLKISDEEWAKIPDLPEDAEYWCGLRAPAMHKLFDLAQTIVEGTPREEP